MRKSYCSIVLQLEYWKEFEYFSLIPFIIFEAMIDLVPSYYIGELCMGYKMYVRMYIYIHR